MRVPFIDFLKGMAIVPMIIFNYSVTLSYFNVFTLFQGNFLYWFIFPRIVASIFIFSSGISAFFSFKRRRKEFSKRYFKRGLKLFFVSMIITTITYLYLKEGFIIFGIIHFFALTSFFIPLLNKLSNSILFSFSLISIFLGILFDKIKADNPFLIPIGIYPENFFTFDYFPIFPWIGLISFGIIFGRIFYKKIKNKKVNFKLLTLLGKHSLLIYILHQPILVAFLELIK